MKEHKKFIHKDAGLTVAQQAAQCKATATIVNNRSSTAKQQVIQTLANKQSSRNNISVSQATAQLAKRTGFARAWHAFIHPQRAYRNRNKPSVTASSILADESWVTEMMTKKKQVTPNLNHTIEKVDKENWDKLRGQLNSWLVKVQAMKETYNTSSAKQSTDEKKALGASYYDEKHADFRKRHKLHKQICSDVEGAENEIKSLIACIDNARDHQLFVAKKDDEIQGILEADLNFSFPSISNIAINPSNIRLETDTAPRAKNTLRDLLQAAISHNLKNGGKELTLFALSTRVKKIYAHYGFLVDTSKKKNALVARPEVERDAKGWRTYDGVLETKGIKESSEWHTNDTMAMTKEKQNAFIKKYYA